MARSAKAAAAEPSAAETPERDPDLERLIAPWRKDPNFEVWLNGVMDRVSAVSANEKIKAEAGQPSNDLILGAEITRRLIRQELARLFYTEPKSPKGKQQAQMVKLPSRGFVMP